MIAICSRFIAETVIVGVVFIVSIEFFLCLLRVLLHVFS